MSESSRVGGETLDLPGFVPERPVGGYDLVEPTDEAVELCARIVHAVVEAMNRSRNELTLTWEQSRDSCIDGVRRVIANPTETPEENHEAWMAYRRQEGWTYGPKKDPVAKTHPCMVPYAALNPFQQSKDAVFHAVVRTFFGLNGTTEEAPEEAPEGEASGD